MPRILAPIESLTARGRSKRLRREQDPVYAERMRQEGRDYAAAHPGQYYQNNKEKVRDRQLLRTYGITAAEYDAKLKAQRYRCEICGKKATGKPPARASLHLDHNHKTRKLRGFICATCNHALGNAHDDVELLRKAIVYLESYA